MLQNKQLCVYNLRFRGKREPLSGGGGGGVRGNLWMGWGCKREPQGVGDWGVRGN